MIATLLGLSLAPLYAAIAEVESDRGATSDNIYQVRVIYVEDCNRIKRSVKSAGKTPYRYTVADTRDKRKSEEMMLLCWRYYGRKYSAETGRIATYEVLARMHNGGPDGWKKRSTLGYWRRVKKVLSTQTDADVKSWSSQQPIGKER